MALNTIKKDKEVGNFDLELNITTDYSKAYLEIKPKDKNVSFSEFPSQTDVDFFLRENMIIYGVMTETIDSMIKSRAVNRAILVAQQLDPVDGSDAKIENKYNPNEQNTLVQDEHGNIDFKDLNWFIQITEGEEIAKKIPETAGTDGIDLRGMPIKAKAGKDKPFRYGRNVEVSEDGLRLIALKSGRLEDYKGKLSVNNVLTINGDVDVSVGNVEFDGDVVIRGDIKPGYNIDVKGSLEVYGVIEASNVDVGGDLVVRGGIKASETSYITSGGTIVCKFIENANVSAYGDITSDFILHSTISTSGKIRLHSRRSMIAGGHITARDSITVNVVGSNMGTKTEITLGIDIERSKKIEKAKSAIAQHNKRIEFLVPDIRTGKDVFQRGKMDIIRKVEYIKILKEYNTLTSEVEELKAEVAQIESEIREFKFSYLTVKQALYPGTKIFISEHSKTITDEMGPCKIFLQDGEIKIQKG